MKVHLTDQAALRRIAWRDLKSYLDDRGWTLVDRLGDKALAYVQDANVGDGPEILVPTRDDLGDYVARMAEAVEILADAEQRSALDVYGDICHQNTRTESSGEGTPSEYQSTELERLQSRQGRNGGKLMSGKQLGRLEKVKLRDYWQSEAGDFTPWLAEEGNIEILGEAIGLELEVEAQEKSVGPFRADILCRNTADGHWVLIENQLERTDHTHLGQLMTYAAGLNAVTIVWISARFTEEHRAALDWLNDITDESFNFFGLEVELWRIGDSLAAPKFNMVSKPNDWTRSVTEGTKTIGPGELTPTKQSQLDFWSGFREHMLEAESPVKPSKARPDSYMPMAIGRTGFGLMAMMTTWSLEAQETVSGEIRAELYLSGDLAKAHFHLLMAEREAIEADLGEPLTWYNPEGLLACRIYVARRVDLGDRTTWPESFEWLRVKLERLREVFRERVRALDATTWEPDEPTEAE